MRVMTSPRANAFEGDVDAKEAVHNSLAIQPVPALFSCCVKPSSQIFAVPTWNGRLQNQLVSRVLVYTWS